MQHHSSFFQTSAIGIVLLAIAASLFSIANSGEQKAVTRTVYVTGSGTDELKGAIVHSKQPTSTGVIQRSTETVELTGDLRGRVLYHVTSVFDLKAGTLVNTGDQVFSGTVAGSEPVLLHDSKFRFDGDLNSGEDTGSVYLLDHIAGPRVECILKVIGTGKNQDGNPTFTYNGQCRFLAA
jgi:hypothetical protein